MGNFHIILDRDGVINEDSDQYIKSPDEWIPIPGSLEAIARLDHAGYSVAVATNQSGIARGLFSEKDLDAMHGKMYQELARLGAHIDLIAWCPHGPGEGCHCRKPAPGLYETIAERWRISLKGIPIIGDSLRDLQAAVAVAARPILVRTGKGRETEKNLAEIKGVTVYDNLDQAVSALLKGISKIRDARAGQGGPATFDHSK